ncbi:hypothetical protein DRQ53_02370 [bacterium]|nr:MAG: hypothetical protein DRQ53_02370 [bacterium]
MSLRTTTLLAAFALLLAGPAVADNAGFIHGTVITESGTEYRGFLRWGRQEAFWDDIFHSMKKEMPFADLAIDYLEEEGDEPRNRHGEVKVFKWKIAWEDDGYSSRVFSARFGDISTIRVTGNDEAELTMRSGEVYDVAGYSDDVGGKIHVLDESLGEIDLKWDRIETIEFSAAPSGLHAPARRLYGLVETEIGDFEGYIMWDKEECMATDLLDGESEDGDMSIEMGRISSIEPRGSSSSIVILEDGRKLRLRGSNDVNDDNRGIMVEDERYGKITVGWDSFDRLEFREAPGSGRGYDDYDNHKFLRGTAVEARDIEHSGQLVYDLDESESWEALNGRYRDVEFDIPFERITSVEPYGHDSAVITLRGGEEIELEDSQDVSDSHDGILVLDDRGEVTAWIAWDDLEIVRFE